MTWNQLDHADEYLVFPDNIGPYLSIDELSLSKGELYTFVTNKSGKCKQGTLVAVIKGTLSKDIVSVLENIPLYQRELVLEVTMDMANNMESASRQAFPKAQIVTDRFHVVKLATEALQHIRIKNRWDEIDKENAAIKNAKEENRKHKPIALSNGDTPKQLLARCRLILYKYEEEWYESQKTRMELLFKLYPKIKVAYEKVIEFRNIFKISDRNQAQCAINKWIEETEKLKYDKFNTVCNTVKSNMENILNFFVNRNTNANAESFNAKLKLFRANLRGVIDTKFFLFRITKLLA